MQAKTLIRTALNGIVYWVDNATGDCYTYAEKPALIGRAVKDPFDPKTLHIQLRTDWKTVMERELATIPVPVPAPVPVPVPAPVPVPVPTLA